MKSENLVMGWNSHDLPGADIDGIAFWDINLERNRKEYRSTAGAHFACWKRKEDAERFEAIIAMAFRHVAAYPHKAGIIQLLRDQVEGLDDFIEETIYGGMHADN